MSAPIIWIFLPFVTGLLILFFLGNRFSPLIGGTTAMVLALIALIFPIDTALLLGSISIKISSSVLFFGRSFAFNTADGPLVAIIYGLAALWFFGTEASSTANRFVSLGLMIVALLTASIAVEPFLFAALLLDMAAMLAIPMLVPIYQKPGHGVARFLIYQTFAMPFILFSGWMLAGVEASPGDIGATIQAGTILGLGFAFLLGVFPLYTWIPMLMEEASPYVTGFLLWALPTFTVIFALGFLDRYTWLHTTFWRHSIRRGFHGGKWRALCFPAKTYRTDNGIRCNYRDRTTSARPGIEIIRSCYYHVPVTYSTRSGISALGFGAFHHKARSLFFTF
jgi:NADH-quinone oxidoreductase subunit N